MELISVVILAVFGIIAAASSKLLADEFKAWAPWITSRIIKRAVRNSPENKRERLTEEWSSHVQEIPGDVGKLFVAFDLFRASLRLGLHPYVFGKRVFDVVMSSAMLVAVAPLMAVAAMAIRLDSRGPILFAARYRGPRGELIRIYKFRTLRVSGDVRNPLEPQERPSVTRVGKYLRPMGLDQLPQLFNVLNGEMSMVGPRPALPDRHVDDHPAPSLVVKPGITGYAQVNGVFGEKGREEYDRYYIQNRSLLLDLKIILATVYLNMNRHN